MALMSFLATVMFWADPEQRAYDTITILITLAAFSVVVNDNIPQVGYLTIFDYYIATLFYLVSLCVLIHVFTSQVRSFDDKLGKWPLRQLYLKLSDYIGRTFLMPFVVFFYLIIFRRFSHGYNREMEIAILIICSPIYLYAIVYLETVSLRRTISITVDQLDQKIVDEKVLSKLECILLNLHYYRSFSTNISSHRARLRNLRMTVIGVDMTSNNPLATIVD